MTANAPESAAGTVLPPGRSPLDVDIHLRELLETLLAARYMILGTLAFFLAAAGLYLWCATPIYYADSTIQLEQQKTLLSGLDKLSPLMGANDPRSAAEIEILRSRSLIGSVVQQLKLDIVARPRYFPLIGAAIARMHDAHNPPAGTWPGFGRFAWGGERISVSTLRLPPDLEDEKLVLVAEAGGAYRLAYDGAPLLEGHVGLPASAGAKQSPVGIFVAELVARPGTQFILTKKPFPLAVYTLQKKLHVTEKNRQSGILQVSLEGPDPVKTMQTIDGIANGYVRQNVERQSEEASRMLDFLSSQMPNLKSEVDNAEGALKDYKSRTGANVELTVEGQALLARLTEVEKEISMLNLERIELKQRFTEQHPMLMSMQEKMQKLQATRAAIESQLKSLPNTEWGSVKLVRDVKVANELYVELLNKSQELKVSKAGNIGNVRIIDAAEKPWKPVWPDILIILSLALVLGTLAGILLVLALRALRRTLDTPDTLEQSLGLPVYAVIPHSRAQEKLRASLSRSGSPQGLALLAKQSPGDVSVEGLRSLCTSLQFAFADAKNKVVAIHGPTPELGKSFISSNLAWVLAETGKKILLMDADMRKGHLHIPCGVLPEPGLSNCLSGSTPLADAIRHLDGGKLDFLAMGTVPPNSANLLMHDRFPALLRQAAAQYEMVVIDCPPMLNLADAIAIGRHAGTNFLVARAGLTTLDDLRFATRRMEQGGIRVDGVLFNDLRASGTSRRYSDYYAKEYGQART